MRAPAKFKPFRSDPRIELLFTEPAFFTGVDGKNYYRNGHEVMRWQMTESDPQVEAACFMGTPVFCVVQSAYSRCHCQWAGMDVL